MIHEIHFLIRRYEKVKKTNRFLALFLAVLMLSASTVFFTASAEGEPYLIVPKLHFDSGEITVAVEVYVTGTKAVSGNVSFKYDTELYVLPDGVEKSISGLVKAADGISVVDAGKSYGNNDAMFIDEVNGVIAFPWVVNTADGVTEIDATSAKTLIATVSLVVKPVIFSIEGYLEYIDNFNLTPAVATEVSDIDDIKMFIGKTNILLTDDNYVTKEGIAFDSLERMEGVTGTKGNKTATVKWTKNDKYDNVYIECISVDDGGMVDDSAVPMADGKHQFTNLTNGVKYAFVIIGRNTATGEMSAPSKVLYVTPSKSSSGTSSSAGAREYEVIFDLGNGETQRITVNSGSRLGSNTLPDPVVPEGKKFIGWSEDGKTIINPSTYRVYSGIKLVPIFEDTEEPVNEYHNAYIGGYEDGTVMPNNSIKRSEAAAIIARVSGDFDEKGEYKVNFSDVKNDAWYAVYVGFCAEKGIITGYPDGSFKPDESINRAEFAVMLTRFLGLKETGSKAFPDTENHWADGYIGALKGAEIVGGYTDGTFLPEKDITRAEAVKMVNRAIDRVPSKEKLDKYVEDEGIPFTDLDKSFWGFYDVMEATITHVVSEYHD